MTKLGEFNLNDRFNLNELEIKMEAMASAQRRAETEGWEVDSIHISNKTYDQLTGQIVYVIEVWGSEHDTKEFLK